MKTLRVLSALLSYPTEDHKMAAPEMRAALEAEALVPAPVLGRVLELIRQYETRPLLDLQERYVLLFDRTRSLSLHLFEHVHGESRDRGQAMVELLRMYEESGLAPDPAELPDFLPMYLEYLSTQPADRALEMLGQPLHVLVALRERLAKRKSDYTAVFHALEALARGEVDAESLAAARAEPDDDPEDLEALDAAWEDQPVTFGPGDAQNDGCPRVSDILKRMDVPPAPGLK